MGKKGFKRVILYARQIRANQDINETLMHLIEFLEKQNVAAFIDKDTAASFNLATPVLERKYLKETEVSSPPLKSQPSTTSQ